jgi:hypothetical protein
VRRPVLDAPQARAYSNILVALLIFLSADWPHNERLRHSN